jgi:PII-like signaling protein
VKVEAEQVLCRFHVSNVVRHGSEPLYQWIVDTARREDLQGATVLKGFMGLSAGGAVLRENPWKITQEIPVIVEVVDGPRHIEQLLARVEPVFAAGAITLERAHVALYRAGGSRTMPREEAPRDEIVGTRGAATAAWEVKTMQIPENGVLMRVFIGESDRDPERNVPLYEGIVLRAREANLAGATVLKGPMGFGRNSRVHTSNLFELSTDLPVVIEIVDAEEKIHAFMAVVDGLVSEGLVTLEAVRVLKYASASGWAGCITARRGAAGVAAGRAAGRPRPATPDRAQRRRVPARRPARRSV